MIDAEWVLKHVWPASASVLPSAMQDERAMALLLAIGWQESRFVHRRQIGGPARGFWQFEQAGVNAVWAHPESRPLVADALTGLRYPSSTTPVSVHYAIEHHDALAMALARSLLWTLPAALPERLEPEEGWRQYKAAWRPGKPHHPTWLEAWAVGWAAVDAVQ